MPPSLPPEDEKQFAKKITDKIIIITVITFSFTINSPLILNIPNRDIFTIPLWYNIVKSMRLKYLRKKNKVSQLKLAMDLDMNQNSISRYENGQRQADYTTLIAFADYFDVSIDYLLERTDNPKMNK